MDKEQLKKVVNRLIDEDKWDEASRLLIAVESHERNQLFIRRAFNDVSNVFIKVEDRG